MPYEYRKLTKEEREEVIRQRLERGYPRHAPPHRYRQEGRYLLTAANYEHVKIMASVERRTDFESRLVAAMHGAGIEVFAWVILANHYHILVGVPSLNIVSPIFKQLHGATSREWNMADGQTGKRKVWYKFTDRAIRNDRHFYIVLNYIHHNPVKHGYVDDAHEWPWSSLENYMDAHGPEWLRTTWKEYPPEDFGKGWDD